MAYYTNLFSPETYEAFMRSPMNISGFRLRQQNVASKLRAGDRLICYMTKLSRWCGVLEVASEFFIDDSPIFAEDDPFVVRFFVKPIIWLEKEKAIPIREDNVWTQLSFTTGQPKNSYQWTGKLRASLNHLDDSDGRFLENLLLSQVDHKAIFPVDEIEYSKWITHTIRRADKVVAVTVPQNSEEDLSTPANEEVRESIKIQALIAEIGAKMGMKIWLPNSDRARVIGQMRGNREAILSHLPLNYNELAMKTIEQIDVLWIKGMAIVRAFEVEHTTSIYSGLLRMADLLALLPNMDINLHIVAPFSRRDKVFDEIRRPVFSLLEYAPLSERCTFISYDSLRELGKQKHLNHLPHSVLDEYADEAE